MDWFTIDPGTPSTTYAPDGCGSDSTPRADCRGVSKTGKTDLFLFDPRNGLYDKAIVGSGADFTCAGAGGFAYTFGTFP